jgi:hypothetical protein
VSHKDRLQSAGRHRDLSTSLLNPSL